MRSTATPKVVVTASGGDWLETRILEDEGGWRVEVQPVSPALPAGQFDAAITIECDAGCASAVVPLRLTVELLIRAANSSPQSPPANVVASSFLPGITNGAWMSIFGERLASTARLWEERDFNGDQFPLELDGVRVTVAGKPAPVSYISQPDQLPGARRLAGGLGDG
ncbi:MAG: hypothetical protein KIT83_01810 [Bryobacterales bacterium]|nr:hypothetical protein [Bryobacterales bacterium]